MFKKNNFHFFLFGLTAIAVAGAGCSKIELNKQTDTPSAKLFSDGVTIPSDFKWSSVKIVDVRVTINDKFGGKYFYRVELYDNDPMLGTGANLLGAGLAKQGQDFVGKIQIPVGLPYVYLKQTSPVGISSVTMLAVGESNSLIVSKIASENEFTGNTLRVASGSSAAGIFSPSADASTSAVVVPADAIEISGSGTVSVVAGKSYVVKSGTTFTGQIDANNGTNGVKVYIDGIWRNPTYTLIIGSNNAIYTTTSGRIELNTITQNTTGAFQNYGTAVLSEINTANETLYANYGTLTADRSTFSNGSFTNYGTATIKNLTSTTGSTKIRNEGTLTITTASLTNATLDAICHTKIGTLTTNNAIVNIADKALLSITTLDAGGTRLNLTSAAILDVSGTAKFNSNRNYMNASGAARAVARLKKVDVLNQWQAITYSGNLEIACSDHTPNGQWSTYYILDSPATMVPYDKSTVVIAATTCNAGGNNDKGASTTPVNQTLTETNLGTYSYAFEDKWPDTGDYDMNDFVVDMNIVKFQNSSNKIAKVVLKGKLRSVGAANRLAAAVQLDGIPAGNIKSVTYSRPNLVGSSFRLGANGVETGQTYAVATIADDAHSAFGVTDTRFISTQNGGYTPVEVVITIEFNTPLDNFTYQNLNVFIVNSGQGGSVRNEVHLVGYSATDKINKSSIEKVKGSKLSLTDPFKSVHNEPWGLCIPVSFVSPLEAKNIKEVYPKFENWAISGGTKDTNWYLLK
jgi:LruC domain-containing protein